MSDPAALAHLRPAPEQRARLEQAAAGARLGHWLDTAPYGPREAPPAQHHLQVLRRFPVSTPASVVLRRRLEWSETDPMGRWHYSSVFRFVESAESQLHTGLGFEREAFPRMPRMNFTVDFLGALHYTETAEVRLVVESMGRSSLRYGFTISRNGTVLARGSMTVVWFDPDTGRSAPWPEHLRKLLWESGPVPG
jgi:acyl-CoA thioester hydrolase